MRNLVFMVLVLLMAAAFAVVGAPAPATQANSDVETATDGSAPSGLTATYTEGRLTLSWTKGTDATYTEQIVEWRESGATPIRWRTGGMPTDWERLDFPIHLLEPGTTYVFRMSGGKLVDGLIGSVASSNEVTVAIRAAASGDTEAATAAQGEPASDPSPAQDTRPVKTGPTDLTARAALYGDGVRLSWTPGNNPNYVRQVVLRRVAEVTPIAWTRFPIGISDSTYTDYSAEPGTPYIYRVRAEKANDKGGETDAAQIIGPGAPDNRKASALEIRRTSPFGVPLFLSRGLFWNPPQHPRYTRQFAVHRVTYFDENGVPREETIRTGPYSEERGVAFFQVQPNRTYSCWVETQREDDARIKKVSATVWDVVTGIPIPPPGNP